MANPDTDRCEAANPRVRGLLSVIVPCFNEEDNVDRLHERLTTALTAFGRPYELVFVDDGSKDGTFARLQALFERDPAVRVIRFTRNFGQQMALTAGLREARGETVVIIDADMQTSPEEIPLLVNKLDEGHDIVYGTRQERKDPLWRRVGSHFVSYLLRRFTGIAVPDSASGFLALDGAFVDKVNRYTDKARHLSGLFAWLGNGRAGSVPISHSPRQAGVTKYNFFKCVSLTLDFVCNFSTVPLRIVFYAGWAVLGLGAIMLLATLVMAGMYGGSVAMGLWGLASAIVFFAGAQLLATGTLGEYLGRTYREAKEQPLYVVRERLESEARMTVSSGKDSRS